MVVYPHQRKDHLWTVLHESVQLSEKLAPSTKVVYLRKLDSFAEALGTQPSYWSMERLRAFYRQLCEQNKPQTARGLINAIRFAVDYYNQERLGPHIDDEFTQFELKRPRGKNKRLPLSEKEAEALLETCLAKTSGDLRDFAMIVSMLETGWREISVVNAHWERIEEIEPGLTIIEVRAKGIDDLPIPLSPTTLVSLRPWRTWCKSQGLPQKGPVFRSLVLRGKSIQIGTKTMTEQAVYNMIKKRAKEAKIARHIHPQLLRHTFVTWRSGIHVPPSVIQSVVGHKITGFSRTTQGYINYRPLWRQAIITTPPWLAELVNRFVR